MTKARNDVIDEMMDWIVRRMEEYKKLLTDLQRLKDD
jgi:hypothetical protein